MAPEQLRSEGCAPERRRVVRVVQLTNLAFLVVDLQLHGATWPVVLGRLLISADLLAVELLLASRVRAGVLRWALAGLAAAAAAGFGVLALGSGGAASPYVTFVSFLAIVVGIAVPDEPAVNVTAGAAGAAVALAFHAGRPAAEIGFVLAAHGSCTFYGAASAALYRRMRRRERAAWAAQAEAAAALARSELRRAVAERAAAVGRVAAELGHELSGPAAAVAANLRFLEEELARRGSEPELRAAVEDSCAAMGRVGRVVRDLRVLTPAETGSGGPVDLAPALEHGLELAALRLGGPAPVASLLPPELPPVLASAHHLSQVMSLLVGLLVDREPLDQPIALEVAVEEGAVRLVLVGGAAGGPERAGVQLALCRELVELWGGRVEARAVGGGRLELALTLQRAGPEVGGGPRHPGATRHGFNAA